MELKIFYVDAFTDEPFRGNPAAVCQMNAWPSDLVLQNIAAENNLSETAFLVKSFTGFHLRWFTPKAEVKLCGHATLASAFVLFNFLGYPGNTVTFDTLSGELSVTRVGSHLEMDFPNQEPEPCDPPKLLLSAFKLRKGLCFKGEDYILVLDSEKEVLAARPDLKKLSALDLRGVGITARGNHCDFVSRFFAPKFGIPEDPVTGSLHTQIGPYWAKLLNKAEMQARQISSRGGELGIKVRNDRILISGQARLFMEGTLHLDAIP